ncbi:hypothetical protein K466DRAFT_625531 [Polyporus arcularius HHB13444]|uniref:Uncharacterized protein n=1 Tax=Polyporus arcularius HHB13444 TaxID=1314778 RepID=A0A5C3P7I6_9APHY|nr:hypothetical protein K466DRAFT_625531 [Polyporus arcularius HHB13444]
MTCPAAWPEPPPRSECQRFEHLRKVHTEVPRVLRVAESVLRDGEGHEDTPLPDNTWELCNYRPPSLLAIQKENFSRVADSSSPAAFWKAYRTFTGSKARPVTVSAASLLPVFQARMNPPGTLPPQFDRLRAAVLQLQADNLPRPSTDTTAEQFFSRPFTVEEIDAMKAHVQKSGLGTATGLDRLSYTELFKIPSDELRDLFQQTIARSASRAVPSRQ